MANTKMPRRKMAAGVLVSIGALAGLFAFISPAGQAPDLEVTGSLPGESSAGRRRLLGRELLSSWKKKKFCPPGLDICKQEENRKKEEADEKKKARLEREAAEAAELEELSGKVGTAQTPLEFYAPSLPLGGQPFEERGGGEWGGPPGEDG